MIIFDLDGTLANCEHRQHFVDPKKNLNYTSILHSIDSDKSGFFFVNNETGKQDFTPDWKAFYESCDKDKLIEPTYKAFSSLQYEGWGPIQIWSGRCESVRAKTNTWLMMNGFTDMELFTTLKMRPIGDFTPDDKLKEKWLDEFMFGEDCKFPTLKNAVSIRKVDYVFDSDPKSIKMWQKRGIFVFNCAQDNDEF